MQSLLTAFDYLYLAITSAQTANELTRFDALAKAHYSGERRRLLTDAITVRRDEIDQAAVRRNAPHAARPAVPADAT